MSKKNIIVFITIFLLILFCYLYSSRYQYFAVGTPGGVVTVRINTLTNEINYCQAGLLKGQWVKVNNDGKLVLVNKE
ncbi:MAG: hypothetical protein OS130_01865 [Thermodesulfobacteriota bacterium]|jgi:hypothetical protein|nr:MAG: hypothetical protein OS130_01865 [Thermodesulfobacteriota bacterium]